MNSQLRIIINPTTLARTLEPFQLERLYDSNTQPITVTDGSVWVYDGETQVFTDTTSGGLTVVNDRLQINWDASAEVILTEKPKSNYWIRFEVNTTLKFDRWFDVVYWKFVNPVREIDLLIEKPELGDYRPQRNIQISSSTTKDEVVCQELTEPDDFWNGSILEIKSGAFSGEKRIVITWVNSTRTLTVDSDFTEQPLKGYRFQLNRSFNPEITAAWTEITMLIQGWAGKFTKNNVNTLIDSYDLQMVHKHMSFAKIGSSLRVKEKDTFDLIREENMVLYQQALSAMQAKVDTDNAGFIDQFDTVRDGTIWATM